MNVLITGIGGFIGANLSRYLYDKGYNIIGLDNFSTGTEKNVPHFVKLKWGSIENNPRLYFSKEEIKSIDTIIHLAACSGVQNCNKAPIESAFTNIIGTISLLNFAIENNIKKFIFASSGGTILGAQNPPVHEESPVKPISPYGASKAAGEHYVNSFNQSFGLDTTIVRFSNVYGPYSLHKPNNLIPAFLLSCIDGREFNLYGNGEQTRDFIYVDDLIDCIYKILINNTSGETFQVATSIEIPINTIIDEMNFRYYKITGNWKEIKTAPKQIGDIEKNFALINKAEEKLNWFPKISYEEGIQKLFEYYLL